MSAPLTEEQKELRRQRARANHWKRYPKKQALRKLQRANNPEFFKRQRRAYYLKGKEKEAQAHKQWVARNRMRMNELNARRRALRVNATINLAGIQEFIASIKAKASVHCYYCHTPTPTANIHFDHIIPLVKGGAHSVENLCATCATCNLRKGAKTLVEWAAGSAAQQLLNL